MNETKYFAVILIAGLIAMVLLQLIEKIPA